MRGKKCLRGKPDRGAEFCKATDYNQFLKNRQIPLALEAILSQESTVSNMTILYHARCGNVPVRTLSQSVFAGSQRNRHELPLFHLLRKLRQAICYSYNAAP